MTRLTTNNFVFEKMQVVRNGQTVVTFLSPKAMVISGPGLLCRAGSWSMTLTQYWWVLLISMAPVTIKGPEEAWSLGHQL